MFEEYDVLIENQMIKTIIDLIPKMNILIKNYYPKQLLQILQIVQIKGDSLYIL